ncbi:hypothetical protein [Ferrimicrobium sp.]|uniref:hypothetical protein n=1 Tax=Ferrimicrobium sp. TaxID=2926050 RepID=UPI002610D1DC|nr:hypothetical protein [Ferrimicrobium sp.]
MSHRPLLVVIEEDGVASTTLAHLAPHAHDLRIRCLDSPQPLTDLCGGGLVITSLPLENRWQTLTSSVALTLDPSTLVQMAHQATAQAQAPHRASSTRTSTTTPGMQNSLDEVGRAEAQSSGAVTEWTPSPPVSPTPDAGMPPVQCPPPTSAPMTAPNPVSLADGAVTDIPPNLARSPRRSEQIPPHPGEVGAPGFSGQEPIRGCYFIPVLGIDPGLTAQLSCVFAQLFAELHETILIDFVTGGLQRFLHDLPLEAPSIDHLAHAAAPTSIAAFTQMIAQRGYRLLPQPLTPRTAHELDADRLERLLQLFGESAATIVAPLGASSYNVENGYQAEGVDLLAQNLLHQASTLVLTATGGLTSTYQLINLVRQTTSALPTIRELMIVITGTREELRRGHNLHQLLKEAIPERLSRIVTLEIVMLGTVALDDFHEDVLPFPSGLLRPLRPFAKRATQLPPTNPGLQAPIVTHPFYERVDPLLDFFAKAKD